MSRFMMLTSMNKELGEDHVLALTKERIEL
jgi:hypothetical protein